MAGELVFYGKKVLRTLALSWIAGERHIVDIDHASYSHEGRCLRCGKSHKPDATFGAPGKIWVHFPEGKVEFDPPLGPPLVQKIRERSGKRQVYLKTYRAVNVALFSGPRFCYHSPLFEEVRRRVGDNTDAFQVLSSAQPEKGARTIPIPYVVPEERSLWSIRGPFCEPLHVFVRPCPIAEEQAEVDLSELGIGGLYRSPGLPAEALAAKVRDQYFPNGLPQEKLLVVYRRQQNEWTRLNGEEMAAGNLRVRLETFDIALGLERTRKLDIEFNLRCLALALRQNKVECTIEGYPPLMKTRVGGQTLYLGYDPWRGGCYVADETGMFAQDPFPSTAIAGPQRNISFRVFPPEKAVAALLPEIQEQLQREIRSQQANDPKG